MSSGGLGGYGPQKLSCPPAPVPTKYMQKANNLNATRKAGAAETRLSLVSTTRVDGPS